MGTFNLGQRINIANPYANLDSNWGPYNTVSDACAAIIEQMREPGYTVGIITEDGIVEYWWKNGREDTDLIFKTEWVADGDNISNINTGNVGIGTDNPLHKLHVSGDTLIEGDLNIQGNITGQTYYGDGSNLTGIFLDVDSELNSESANPVENQVINSALSSELENRISADNSLEDLINIETDERISADESLEEQISVIMGDVTDIEEILSDGELLGMVDDDLTGITNIQTELSSDLSVETENRIGADESLEEQISNIDQSKWDIDAYGINYNTDNKNVGIGVESDENYKLNISGNTNINGDFTINGDIYQKGEHYETHIEKLYTQKDLIISRSGSTIPIDELSGIKVLNYNGEDDLYFGTDSDGYFKVGEENDLQILTTRQDEPTNSGLTYWNEDEKRLDTSDNLKYNGDLKLTGDTLIEGDLNIQGNITGQTYYGDGSNLTGIFLDVDSELNSESANPVENQVITSALSSETEYRVSGDESLAIEINNIEDSIKSIEDDVYLLDDILSDGELLGMISGELSGITNIQSELSIEIENRISVDESLESELVSESEDRISADTSLENSIIESDYDDTELITAMESADNSLETSINTETTERISADESLASEISSIEYIKNVTYDELVTNIQNSGLTIGMHYKITDYETKHYMLDGDTALAETNTGSTEVLIVKAISNNKLDIRAYSEDYPQDIIHYDWNTDNWLKDIGFGDNTNIITGFKGVIYFRHDTKNDNSMGYDFRKVKFRRWNNGFTDTSVYINAYQGLKSDSEGVTDSTDFIDVLTFNCPDGESQYEAEVLGNHFAPFREDTDKLQWIPSIPSILQNNVFHLESASGWLQVHGNTFGIISVRNTFNGHTESSNILEYFFNNTIGNLFYNNTIGNEFYDNTIGNNFHSNTIRNTFFNNTIGNTFYGNTIGNTFYNNTFGNYFRNNTIADYFNNNTIGNALRSNTFGIEFYDNIVGDHFYYNTINNDIRFIQTSGSTCLATAFKSNTIKDSVQGTSTSVKIQLTQPVYYDYNNTETYRRPDNTMRLKYYDNNDDRVVINPTV